MIPTRARFSTKGAYYQINRQFVINLTIGLTLSLLLVFGIQFVLVN